jgi:hypothetical protein
VTCGQVRVGEEDGPELLPSIRREVHMILRNEEERVMSKGKHSEAEVISALKQVKAGRG